MHRAGFLRIVGVGAAAFVRARTARAQSTDADPATSAMRARLRVRLGIGDATPAPGGFVFNGRTYSGTFARADDGSIVNAVDLEEYLRSVVPREMPPSWPLAALQAQAVCARTYVLQRSDPRREYDLVPSEIDQVYDGVSTWNARSDAAIEATAERVLRYRDAFATIAYSSCCGGRTEASNEVWNGARVPYLSSIVCPYCTDSPEYRWQERVPIETIERAFAQELAPFGALQDVQLARTDGSGRARSFVLLGERGGVEVKAPLFRTRIGVHVVRSLLILRTRLDAASVTIEGGGRGHGIGLCQWGARGMARTGASAADILAFYFPGTVIARA